MNMTHIYIRCILNRVLTYYIYIYYHSKYMPNNIIYVSFYIVMFGFVGGSGLVVSYTICALLY